MTPNRPRGETILATCPPLRPGAEISHNRTMPDLTDRFVNGLYVMGVRVDQPARWVCRCLCGGYVFRLTRSLTGETAERCDGCKAAARRAKLSEMRNAA